MLLFWVIEIPLNFEERILGCSIQNTFAVLIVILLAVTGESGVYTVYIQLRYKSNAHVPLFTTKRENCYTRK